MNNLPKYWNSSNVTSPYLLEPSKLLSPELNKLFGAGTVDGTLDGLMRRVFPNLPPKPSLVRQHGVQDAVELTEMFNKGKMHVDLGNLERGRPPVTNSAMWGLDDWNNPNPRSAVAKYIHEASQPDYAAMSNASAGSDFVPFMGKLSALLDGSESKTASKNPKIAELFSQIEKTIEKNKKNVKTANIGKALKNYFNLKTRPVFGKALADQASDGVAVVGPYFETPSLLDHLGDYIPKIKGMSRSYGERMDRGAVGELKKNPVLVNLSGETKKDLAKEIGVKRNTQVLGEGNVGGWDKLEEAQNSPGFIPKAQDLANLIKHKNQLRGGKAEEILNKAYPSGWVVKKREAGSTLETMGKKHPELFFSDGKDSLRKISPKTRLGDWMVQEKKQIDAPAFNQVTNNLAKKLFNYHGGSGNAEYRVHSIDGRVIPGATIDRGSPIGFVKNFVPGWETSRRKMLEKYMQQALNKLPANKRKLNYGADIAMTPEGKPFVVEMNPISNEGSSGYYANPLVVDAIRAAVKGRKNLQDITRQYVAPAGALALGGGVMYNQKNKETNV
jgi:hypothetical protein